MHVRRARFTPIASVLLFAVGAVALGGDEPTAGTTVEVVDTRVKYEIPPAPAARPDRPSFELKLPPYKLDSLDYNFPSGLRVIFQADHSQPVVAITMVMDRGSTSDPVGKEGIAHFVEHLWFRSEHKDASDETGTKRLPKTWDLLTDLGCDLNASTSDDWTNYMSVCPSSSLQSLLRLESLRITEPIEGVKEEVVDTEREVIRNELRMRYENTELQVLPYLFDKLYPVGHPYQRLGIGTHESLLNCHLADIQKFTETNYRPENATIVVVGDFDLEQVPKLIAENLDPKLLVDPKNPDAPLALKEAPHRISGPAPEPPPPADRTMSEYEYAGEDPMVVVAWTVPGAYRGEDWDMRLMAGIAGNYIQQYFYQAHEFPVDWKSTGCFLWDSKVDSKVMCFIPLKSTDKVNPDQIAQRAADQVAFMWDADYNYDPNLNLKYIDAELQRYKMDFLAQTLRGLDLFAEVGEGSRATQIAHWAHFTGSYTYHSDVMNESMQVKSQTITDLAYKYLRRDRMVNVYLKPLPEDKLVMAAAESATYHGAKGEDQVLRSTYDPSKITPEVIKDYTITPDIGAMIDRTLPNGMRLVVLSHGEAPLVEAGLYFHGGSASSPLGLDDFADDFALTAWNDYGRRGDPLRIAGAWQVEKGDNYTYDAVQASSGNLDGALWLLRDAMESFHAVMDGAHDWAKTGQSRLKTDWKYRDGYYGPGFVTQQRMQQVNPGHPLSWSWGWDDYTRMDATTSAQVMGYVKRKYQPANATLVIVGNVDAESSAKLGEYYFQGWKAASGVETGKLPGNPPPNPSTAPARIVLYDDKGKTQTDVTFACAVAPADTTNDATRLVLGDYLSEQTWIILRENGGVTYGAGAGFRGNQGGTARLSMNSLVQNEGTVLAVQTFGELATKATAGEFDMDRIAQIKLSIAKKYVLYQQSVPQMRYRLFGTLGWDTSWEYVTGFADRLAAVDAKAMATQMGTCTEHSIIQIEGPKDAVTPGLDAAGVVYETFDWKQAGKDELAKWDPKAAKKAAKAEAKAKAKEDAEGTTTPE